MKKVIKNMKTFKKNKSTCITIPQEVLRLLDLNNVKEFEVYVNFETDGDSIVIKRKG